MENKMKKDAITKYYENVEMDFLLNTCFTYQDYYVISDLIRLSF